jgi:hypothetical protein
VVETAAQTGSLGLPHDEIRAPTDIGQERYEQQYKQRVLQRLARKAQDFGFQLVPCHEKQVP